MRQHLWDVLAAVFLVAIVYVLVRPQSKASELVRGFGDALAALVTTATNISGG